MKFPERYRFKKPGNIWHTEEGTDYGLFYIPTMKGPPLKVLAAPSDSEWQHVSVSLPNQTPTWKQMCMVKDLFWDEDETVIQFHPKKSEYVNNHPRCLHLWRHKDGHELPPSILVGFKN